MALNNRISWKRQISLGARLLLFLSPFLASSSSFSSLQDANLFAYANVLFAYRVREVHSGAPPQEWLTDDWLAPFVWTYSRRPFVEHRQPCAGCMASHWRAHCISHLVVIGSIMRPTGFHFDASSSSQNLCVSPQCCIVTFLFTSKW